MISPLVEQARVDRTVLSVAGLHEDARETQFWLAQPPAKGSRRWNCCARLFILMTLPRDFQEFLRLLNAHGVEYVIVGGYAVIYHGYVRYTGDLDEALTGATGKN